MPTVLPVSFEVRQRRLGRTGGWSGFLGVTAVRREQ